MVNSSFSTGNIRSKIGQIVTDFWWIFQQLNELFIILIVGTYGLNYKNPKSTSILVWYLQGKYEALECIPPCLGHKYLTHVEDTGSTKHSWHRSQGVYESC